MNKIGISGKNYKILNKVLLQNVCSKMHSVDRARSTIPGSLCNMQFTIIVTVISLCHNKYKLPKCMFETVYCFGSTHLQSMVKAQDQLNTTYPSQSMWNSIAKKVNEQQTNAAI